MHLSTLWVLQVVKRNQSSVFWQMAFEAHKPGFNFIRLNVQSLKKRVNLFFALCPVK